MNKNFKPLLTLTEEEILKLFESGEDYHIGEIIFIPATRIHAGYGPLDE